MLLRLGGLSRHHDGAICWLARAWGARCRRASRHGCRLRRQRVPLRDWRVPAKADGRSVGRRPGGPSTRWWPLQAAGRDGGRGAEGASWQAATGGDGDEDLRGSTIGVPWGRVAEGGCSARATGPRCGLGTQAGRGEASLRALPPRSPKLLICLQPSPDVLDIGARGARQSLTHKGRLAPSVRAAAGSVSQMSGASADGESVRESAHE